MSNNSPIQNNADLFSSMPQAESATAFICPLADEGLLRVSGQDAERFLQGQLTCDLRLLEVPGSSMGARCNPKGRMQSSFRLLRRGETDYLLAMDQHLVEGQLADLSKYAVFFKVQLEDISQTWVRVGLWGEGAKQALQQAGLNIPTEPDQVAAGAHQILILRLPGSPRYELWCPAEHSQALVASLSGQLCTAPPEQWQCLNIRQGVGRVRLQTRESFIPQMLNLHLFSAVSFKKGCYTGQEIVARMQYLGKLKKRMFRFLMTGTEALQPGTAIIDQGSGQTVGEVVESVSCGEQVEILAVVQKDAAQLETLCAIDHQGSLLTLTDLPYDSELVDTETSTAN